jgi:hypothetical protein
VRSLLMSGYYAACRIMPRCWWRARLESWFAALGFL